MYLDLDELPALVGRGGYLSARRFARQVSCAQTISVVAIKIWTGGCASWSTSKRGFGRRVPSAC